MHSFRWDDSFLTGLPLVDEQHHYLIDLLNRFGDVLLQADTNMTAEVEKVFAELAEYAKYHFDEEERHVMVQNGLDARYLAYHRKQHEHFLSEVTRLRAGMSSGNPFAANKLLKFLINWLVYHILCEDKNLAKQIADIQSGKTPAEAYESLAAHIAANFADPLVNALHGLFQEVSDRNRELAELNRLLEMRVEERTRELRESNRVLEEMALTDVLTGLPNRRYALIKLQKEWDWTGEQQTLACLLIDADGFKPINDTFGHDAGDEVLRQVARQLRHHVRTDDSVCRLGGDEFLVILPHTPLQGAVQVAENLRQSVAAMRVPVNGSEGQWCGSISIGVAVRNDDMTGYEDLIKSADEGVYEAKRRGRNCVAIGSESI